MNAAKVVAQLIEFVQTGRDEEAVALWRRVGREVWSQLGRDERATVLAMMETATRFAAEPSAS